MKREREDLTYEEVKDLLSYDPATGVLTWKVDPSNNMKSGAVAGGVGIHYLDGKKYRRVRVKGLKYQSHRVAFLLQTERWPRGQIDHINHDGLDNRWENLREATPAENSKNQTKYKNNKSGVTGVIWNKADRKWMAYINMDGKRLHLGIFILKEDAALARKEAEIKYGYHENHGKEKN